MSAGSDDGPPAGMRTAEGTQMLIGILLLSIVLQVVAAYIALRLVGPSGGRRAWILIASAFCLRGIRLSYQSFLFFSPKFAYQMVLWDEILGLAVSAMLLLGVWWIRPLFEAFHEAERERELYAHSISHDLRAPLAVVRGFSEWLASRYRGKVIDADFDTAVRAILHSSASMEAMIADLVDAARSEGQQLELERKPLHLEGFLPAVIARALPPGEQDRVRVEVAPGVPPVLADQERVERVLLNLVTNALKFSPPEAPVIVRGLQAGEMAAISVEDCGTGIAAGDLSHIFDRFYRSKANRQTGGVGLGLYISRLLVEAHGGKLWVESTPGHGSTFTFTIPLASGTPSLPRPS